MITMTLEEKIVRESFVFYVSFREAIENLPDVNQLNAFKFIIWYWLFGVIPEAKVDPVAYAIFRMAKPQIDANNMRYINWKKWWEYWVLWGRPKKDWQSSQKPQTKGNHNPNKTPNVNVNVNENVNGNVNVNEKENGNKNKTKKINKKVVYSEDFESFRIAYPKKKGKQKAREAWENAIKWGNDPKVLITKAWEYATEIKLKRIEDHYIKFPQGWLNDWRFDDDYFTGNDNSKPDLDVLY